MDKLIQLYQQMNGRAPFKIDQLGSSGSNRQYYRLYADKNNETVIGVIGTSAEENRSFYELAKLMSDRKLPAPEVYAISDDVTCYIQEDLGHISLYDLLRSGREAGGIYDENQKSLVRQVMSDLADIQMSMATDEVYSNCYPLSRMDRDSVMFDLNYFKYCYLKLTGLEFNEVALQHDFERFADNLLEVGELGFQYRDFQARNVMIKDGMPYYIDFQGGRCGPVYYDLASFLWQASSKFPFSFRREMIDVYISRYTLYRNIDKDYFLDRLNRFVLFRTLQVLGAYGFRGLWEKKRHFLDSIPMALRNLSEVLTSGACDDYSYLKKIAATLCRNQTDTESEVEKLIASDITYYRKAEKPLVVRVFSFSYKKGIPSDESGNGGGYVFDCRSTHNPGRYEQYKKITGLDKPVIDFLEKDGEILTFLDSVYKLVDFHVQRFMDRGFSDLMLSFGCTGGQHRSVYSAQHVAEHINHKFGVEIRICHREQAVLQTLPARHL